MSEKRRDTKGRILRDGESQRKDGRYEYKYTDYRGVRRSIYSWKLVDTDKLPEGRRCDSSLRTMEKQINNDVEDGIDTHKSKYVTFEEWFYHYLDVRRNLKHTTVSGYRERYKYFIAPYLGHLLLTSITPTTIRNYFNELIYERNLKINTVRECNNIVHSVMSLAIRENFIRSDPTLFVLNESVNPEYTRQEKRHALTEEQQSAFMRFVSEKKAFNHWLSLFVFLLGTGCRIGEALGLTWGDCDFDNNTININHAAYYYKQDDGHMAHRVLSTKTVNSDRIIPMLSEVRKVLLREKARQLDKPKAQPIVDGYTDFVFVNRNGNLYTTANIDSSIERIRKNYNQKEMQSAALNGRTPSLLPHFSVHNLRHTFCTRYCENESDIKIIQEIMGHASSQTTMDIYNEVSHNRKMKSFIDLGEKLNFTTDFTTDFTTNHS